MKVLVLNSARKYIGEAAHCLALARELSRRGHVAVLAVREGFELEERARAAGCPVLPLAFPGGFNPISDARDARRLLAWLRRERPDVVHCHRGKDHWLVASLRAAGLCRAPIVRTRHVVVPAANHVFNRWLYRSATEGVCAVSREAARSLGPVAGGRPDEVRVILSAVDRDTFSPSRRSDRWRTSHGIGPDDILVGLVGRLQNVKGQHVLIEAAGALAESHPRLKIFLAGTGPSHKPQLLRQRAERLGISGRLVMAGWLDDIATAIASLDLGVIASLGSEGSSRILLEYMASGVPVVATRVGGIPDIAEDGRTALLVDPGDSQALAAAMARILGDPGLAAALRTAAAERIVQYHNYDRWIADILDFYNGAIKARALGRRP